MDNKNVSTNYISLQPPFKIIKHGYKIGVQIGTQRVTIAGGSPFSVKNRDYPVVVAEDRIKALGDSEYSFDSSCEGDVWDNVESKDVSVLCELGTQLHWMDFIKILWHDHSRLGNRCEKIQKVHIFNKIIKYNGSLELPSPGFHTIHLHTEMSGGIPDVVCSARDDVFALNVKWTDDPVALEQSVVDDLMEYLLIISPNQRARWWRMTYETKEERLRPLVDRLNVNAKATSFGNTLMASFTVKAIMPYEGNGTKSSSLKIITWEQKKQCFKNAVLSVMECKKHDGDYLFEKPTQWKAVYRFAVDSGIMYDLNDPKEPKDLSTPQYAVFKTFAHELKFDENPPTRLPFTKNAINDITKELYIRYNRPHPWSHDGITNARSLKLYTELDDVYLALQEEYPKLLGQAEKSL